MVTIQPLDRDTLQSALLKLLTSGESHKTIGDAFGVSREAVFRWVHGVRRPSRTACVLAAYVLAQASDGEPGLPVISGQSAGNQQGSGAAPPVPRRSGQPKRN